jgi:hypothetical protein
LGLNEDAPWQDVAAGLRQSAESCEGCPCPLCLRRTSGCSEGLERRVASLPSPQQRANGMILQGLKPRIYNDLNKFGRRWMKELHSVVWSLRTTPSRATGFTPFFLVYGAEAILPTDLEYGSPRTKAYNEQSNQASREDSLDQLEKARDMALLHSARYQQSLRRYHAEGFGPETFRWATWCFGYDKTPEGATSSHLPGMGRSSSPKF